MTNLTSTLRLSRLLDRYEVKARLLPGLLSCSFIVPGIWLLDEAGLGWATQFSLGGGLTAVGWIGLAYLASAAWS